MEPRIEMSPEQSTALHLAALKMFAEDNPKNLKAVYSKIFNLKEIGENQAVVLANKSISILKEQVENSVDTSSNTKLILGAKNIVGILKDSSKSLFGKPKELPAEATLKKIEEAQKSRSEYLKYQTRKEESSQILGDQSFDQLLINALSKRSPPPSAAQISDLKSAIATLSNLKPEIAPHIALILEIAQSKELTATHLDLLIKAFKDLQAAMPRDGMLKDLVKQVQAFAGSVVIDKQLLYLLGPQGIPSEAVQHLHDFCQKMTNYPQKATDPKKPEPDFTTQLIDLFKKSQVVRDNNLRKLTKGEICDSVDPEVVRLFGALRGELPATVKMTLSMEAREKDKLRNDGKRTEEERLTESFEVPNSPSNQISSLFSTVVTGNLITNFQILTDNFIDVLPPDIRINREKYPELDYQGDRHQLTLNELEEKYQKQKEEIEKSNYDPPENRRQLEYLEERRGFRDQDFYFQRQRWVSVVPEQDPRKTEGDELALMNNPKKLFFIKGTREISYMSADESKIKTASAVLDLSPVNMETPEQSIIAVNFVKELCMIGDGPSAPLIKWSEIKAKKPLPRPEEILAIFPAGHPVIDAYKKAADKFSYHQQWALLVVGLNFAYQMIHDVRLARIGITL